MPRLLRAGTAGTGVRSSYYQGRGGLAVKLAECMDGEPYVGIDVLAAWLGTRAEGSSGRQGCGGREGEDVRAHSFV